MGIEGSTTTTIAIASDPDDVYYRLTIKTGVVLKIEGAGDSYTPVHSWSVDVSDTSIHYVRRGIWKFIWPTTFTTNDDTFLLDPPVFASATFNFTNGIGSVITKAGGDFEFYGALEDTIPFDSTHYPGPPDSRTTGLSATHTWVNLMPRDGMDFFHIPYTNTVDTHSVTLDPTWLNRRMSINGETVWNREIYICAVAKNEYANYDPDNTTHQQVNYTASNDDAQLGIRASSSSTPVTLVVETVPFHTGTVTGNNDNSSRAVRDQRLGAPAFTADLVQDGYKLGLWVNQWDYDPNDDIQNRQSKRTEVRTDNKGVR